MAEEPEGVGQWLVEPPGAGEIKLALGVGEGAELTPRMKDALLELTTALHDTEVQGFRQMALPSVGFFGRVDLDLMSCEKMVCNDHECIEHSCMQNNVLPKSW